ncbi:unnamed protein product [Fraxinus pennsylvanica]|uniref:Uncharacterized protein n=1 Tax=Fraxinus pennsylvanica TaxID=56036 RepID=A0AAD2EBR0_9LAMI|nr:unnamed protein product [Fraxinus pennsylvanica]
MDEDICNVAKDKRSTFIIIPFHKQQTIDGQTEDINPAIRSANEGILENTPCSVENSDISLTEARFTSNSDAEELDPVKLVAKANMTLQIDNERELARRGLPQKVIDCNRQ